MAEDFPDEPAPGGAASHDEEPSAALFHAIARYDYLGLRAALDAGAPVDAPSPRGETPLAAAVGRNFLHGVLALLQHGADPGPYQPESEMDQVGEMGMQERGPDRTYQRIMAALRRAAAQRARERGPS